MSKAHYRVALVSSLNGPRPVSMRWPRVPRCSNSRLDSLDVNVRAQAEQAIAHVKQWIAEGQAQIKNVQAKGAASIAEAKAQIEATWSKFQSESGKWAELAKDQQATFQARAQAQAQAWQNLVNSYMQRAAELHARNKAQAEAHVAEFKADAREGPGRSQS